MSIPAPRAGLSTKRTAVPFVPGTVFVFPVPFSSGVGEGNPVTARYRTSEVDLIARVTLDSGDVVSGTTKHTIWSVSRRSFVEMAELQVGELVDTEWGVASVQSVEVINEPQAVYNLEIAGQHVFRIGKTGVLVHNVDPKSYDDLAENASDVAPKKTIANVLGDDFVPGTNVTTKYKRPSGAGPTAAQRRSVQGRPCVDCGDITPKQVADHIAPLVVQHYREGAVNTTAQSAIDAVQPHCPSCSSRQGGLLSAFSKRMKKLLGL